MKGCLLGWSLIGFVFMVLGITLGLINNPINTDLILIGISFFIGLSIFGAGLEFILYLQDKDANVATEEQDE